jgi:hypothetical protein
MGFRTGTFWFNPNDWYWIGANWGTSDRGAVYLMANPVNQGAEVQVTDYSKERNTSGVVWYWILVHNISGIGTNVNIDGNVFGID